MPPFPWVLAPLALVSNCMWHEIATGHLGVCLRTKWIVVGQCSHVRTAGRCMSHLAGRYCTLGSFQEAGGCPVVICRYPLPGHRLQHGCARGAQGALCLLRAALDHPAQDHLAGGGHFPFPVPPAAAPEPNRRRCAGCRFEGWPFPIPVWWGPVALDRVL